MDSREAAQAAHLICPKMAIPIHFGSIVGSEKDAHRFIELVGDAGRFLPVEKKP
jgi:L-ascorbate metabolism protein UlaG (beta-lactamase superfamily)